VSMAFPPCSRARRSTAGAVIVLALALAGCEREDRRFRELAVFSNLAMSQAHSGLQPAGTSADGELPRNARHPSDGLYDYNAWNIAEGKHLFLAMNCNGCHGQGGGGEGPSLMDNRYRYGSEPGNLFASVVEGRPNGMPSYRGKLTQKQAWQLVGYLQALGGMVALDALPGRSDGLNGRPSETMLQHNGQTRPEAVP
jgi:cytochrome c oxidase cbb3-type subunit 3